MRNTLTRIGTALLLALALAACTDPITMPEATVEGVSGLSADGSFTVDGSGFYQYPDGPGMSVEVCGVTVDATIVDPTTAEILLPPAGVVKIQVGENLTVTLPQGLQGGSGDVRVIRPDGQAVLLEAAIECPTADLEPDPEPEPEPEPDPEPEPEPDPEPEPEPELTPALAVINADVTHGPAPLTVSFNAAGSAGEGDYTLLWDFDDSTTTGAFSITHVFEDPGDYAVTLTVTGENGQTDTATQVITVTEPANRAPTAHFTYNVVDPAFSESAAWILLDGTSSSDPDGDELTYAWYDADYLEYGLMSEEPTFGGPHPYGLPMRVILEVTDPHGATDTAFLTGMVDAPETLHMGEPDPYAADITAVSWTPDGITTRLRLEGVNDLVLPAPGTEPTCGAPGLLAEGAGYDPAALNGWIGLDTDRDPNTGRSLGAGLPGYDYVIVLDQRDPHGAFPIVWAEEYGGPCSYFEDFISGWAQPEIVDGIVTITFITPEGRGTDFDVILEVGTYGSTFWDTLPHSPLPF